MRSSNKKSLWNSLLVAFSVSAIFLSFYSHAAFDLVDKSGTKDHPLVSRFQGSIILNYGSINFESVKVAVSPTKTEVVEGKLHNYLYYAPKDSTALEVFRSYKNALEKTRFKILFACEDAPVCQKQNLYSHAAYWTDKSETFFGGFSSTSRMDSSGNYPPRFLVARLARQEGDITVVLTVKGPSSTEVGRGVGGPYFLQIIESAAMKADSVSIDESVLDSKALKSGLVAEGKISLYGIFFDTGKAEIKAESKSQLDEMAKLLREQKQVKVYIVGHTDNQGDLSGNLALSQKRAEAIVNALISEYKIEANRLVARGVANFSPIATNASESGRRKNRRVELVEQ